MFQTHAGQYRVRAVRSGYRQQVAAPALGSMSRDLRRLLVLALLTGAVLVTACSQVVCWARLQALEQLDQVEAHHAGLTMENIRLRAQRARFMSPDHMQEVAAARLDLYPPAARQVHRM